jgi:hypothetical protein
MHGTDYLFNMLQPVAADPGSSDAKQNRGPSQMYSEHDVVGGANSCVGHSGTVEPAFRKDYGLIDVQIGAPIPSTSTSKVVREEAKMKRLANTTALLVAITTMVWLLAAQRSFQSSWGEPSAIGASNAEADAGTLDRSGGYTVVMK